jgi:hypothetical protein
MRPSRFAVELGIIWNRFAPDLTFSIFIHKFEQFLSESNINPLKFSNDEYLYWLKRYYQVRQEYLNTKGSKKDVM